MFKRNIIIAIISFSIGFEISSILNDSKSPKIETICFEENKTIFL